MTAGKSRSADERLVRAWVQLQSNWWAHGAFDAACEKNPRRAWRLLVRLSDLVTTKALVEIFGAGPLEDFVHAHAPQFIDQIENQARANRRFRAGLRIAYLPRAHDKISRRLFDLGCRPVDVAPAPWQVISRSQRTKIKEARLRLKRATQSVAKSQKLKTPRVPNEALHLSRPRRVAWRPRATRACAPLAIS